MYKRFAAVLVAFMCVFSVAATNSVRRAVPRAAGAAGGDAVCVKISVAGAAGVGGTIIAQLNPTTAPITVKNFLAYVDKQYYSNTIFHRVIKSFMVTKQLAKRSLRDHFFISASAPDFPRASIPAFTNSRHSSFFSEALPS